jgi:spermidine/putrescine transport system substrate-binding protein
MVLFSWADTFPQEVLDAFTAETGIKVVYTYFESNEEMLTKLEAAKGGDYDVVMASDYIVDIARKEGLMQKLDKSVITRYGDIEPAMLNQFYDPDNEYCVPYEAGTPLIIYDPAKVDFEIKGYNDLWNPALEDSVVIIDDARVITGITLLSMGYTMNETEESIIRAAGDKLITLKPNIRVFDYSAPHEKMISGEAAVGFMFTSQIVWALSERPDLKVVYPEEGMGYGIDSCFIPSNAPNPEYANLFLNFILDGKISAQISEFTQYINCVTTAKEYLSPEYLNNEALYIPGEILGDAQFIMDVGPDATALYDEVWTAMKQS